MIEILMMVQITNNGPYFQFENEQILDITTPSLNVVITNSQVIKPVIKLYNFSSFTKFVRAIGYLNSFIKRCKSFTESRLQSTTIIDRNNLDESRNILLSLVQHEAYTQNSVHFRKIKWY